MKTLILSVFCLLPTLGMTQSMYQCTTAEGVKAFQQLPCAQGGQKVRIKVIPNSGGTGLSDDAKAYLQQVEKERAAQAEVDRLEAERQEALNVERAKVKAADRAAAAQEEMAAATRR